MKLKITCRGGSFLVTKSKEYRLTYGEKIRMTLHLLICKCCCLFKHQNKILDKALSVNIYLDQLTDSEKEKVKQLIG
jgi:hypothetical protein